jgi:hypothetical protein
MLRNPLRNEQPKPLLKATFPIRCRVACDALEFIGREARHAMTFDNAFRDIAHERLESAFPMNREPIERLD